METPMRERQVDQTEIKLMQSFVMVILIIGFITDSWLIILFQVVIFLFTIINPILNPFIFIYRVLLRPMNLLEADWRNDNMEAHRFASMIGFSISLASIILLIYGYSVIGWGLTWLILLFGVFALSGWCAGCYSYYMLNKLGLKGFFKYTMIGNKIAGTRPPKGKL
jgi:hypothetical protein